MSIGVEIPRLFIALAEWGACMFCLGFSRKRCKVPVTALFSVAALCLLMAYQYLQNHVPGYLWPVSMIVSGSLMFGFVRLTCRGPTATVLVMTVNAFLLAEFVAAFNWHIYFYLVRCGVLVDSWVARWGFCAECYLILFGFAALFEAFRGKTYVRLVYKWSEAWQTLALAGVAMAVGGLSLSGLNTPSQSSHALESCFIRSLVDFCGLSFLYMLRAHKADIAAKIEIRKMENILRRYDEQYRLNKALYEDMGRRVHDLKHQIALICEEPDKAKRAQYFGAIRACIDRYAQGVRTGNGVLDVVLSDAARTCSVHGIALTLFVQGEAVSFLEPMDLASLFGNALDNAIECVRELAREEDRFLRVEVAEQAEHVLVRIENPSPRPPRQKGAEFVTTKQDKANHGYGIRSIRYITKKYGGAAKIGQEGDKFVVCILFPVRGKEAPPRKNAAD